MVLSNLKQDLDKLKWTKPLEKCLSNYKNVTDSLSHSLTGRFALLVISPLFVDRFERSLKFCQQEFDKEAISDGYMAHSRVFMGVLIFQ